MVRIEALVLDLHLPGISGLELLALWAADPARPDPPVVLTTADPEHPAVRAAVAAGAVAALVPKPFDVDDAGGGRPTAWTGRTAGRRSAGVPATQPFAPSVASGHQ